MEHTRQYVHWRMVHFARHRMAGRIRVLPAALRGCLGALDTGLPTSPPPHPTPPHTLPPPHTTHCPLHPHTHPTLPLHHHTRHTPTRPPLPHTHTPTPSPHPTTPHTCPAVHLHSPHFQPTHPFTYTHIYLPVPAAPHTLPTHTPMPGMGNTTTQRSPQLPPGAVPGVVSLFVGATVAATTCVAPYLLRRCGSLLFIHRVCERSLLATCPTFCYCCAAGRRPDNRRPTTARLPRHDASRIGWATPRYKRTAPRRRIGSRQVGPSGQHTCPAVFALDVANATRPRGG